MTYGRGEYLAKGGTRSPLCKQDWMFVALSKEVDLMWVKLPFLVDDKIVEIRLDS